MNDPHVTAIHYSLVLGEFVQFSPPAESLQFEMENASGILSDTELRIVPNYHYSSRDAAKAAIEPRIQAWAVQAAIQLRIPTLRIEYERTEIIDRAPTPGIISAHAEAHGRAGLKAAAQVIRHLSKYPPPPIVGFAVSSNVDTLWHRYSRYVSGGEPLTSMAYFALTVVTPGKNGRDIAAANYNIERGVLDKLGRLSSERGDGRTPRKASGNFTPLTNLESTWLDEAVRALIIQVGLATNDVPSIRLTMAHLPML